MATVYVGSARIDENGKAYGGAAGDQTGNEVSKQKWYRHSKGWRVFRATDRSIALKIAAAMEAACKNAQIGYDQWQRNSLYTHAEKVGFDVSKVSVKCETDCSALVRVCCAWAGITNLPSGFRTANMPEYLLKTGKFQELKGDKYTAKSAFLGKGDILVTRTSGHTVVALNDGADYEGDPVPVEYELGGRILKNGCEGDDVQKMQAALIALGYVCGAWGANGDFDDATEMAVRAFQKKAGVDIDGDYGPITHAALMATIDSLESAAPESAQTVRISGGNCWVRKSPGTDGAKMGVAKNGSILSYDGEISPAGWLKAVYKSGAGWVSGKYGRLE